MNSLHPRATASALLLTCVALLGCAQTGAPARGDEQGAEAGDDPVRWEAAAPVQQAIAAALRHAEAGHAESPVAFEANVRVRDTAAGSFTRAGADQRAVLYQVATLSRGFPDLGLAIVEGDRLVANYAHSTLAQTVDALRGLEAGARDAIVLEGGFGMGGQYTRGITLAVFRGEGLVDLGRIETYSDICGSGREGIPGPTRVQISVVPGTGLMAERFHKETCESEAWASLGPPAPAVLEPPTREWFVDITRREP